MSDLNIFLCLQQATHKSETSDTSFCKPFLDFHLLVKVQGKCRPGGPEDVASGTVTGCF